MMPRTPDRFERVVKKRLDDILEPISVESQFRDSILGSVAVNLLRAEHRWMVRMVKDFKGVRCQYENQEFGCLIDKGALLTKLTQRRK